MKSEIVGRKKEMEKLEDFFRSKEPEFLAVYGRRRVGKTYLIRQFFNSKPCIFFAVTGLKDGPLKVQLELFTRAIEETFYDGKVILEKPKRWLDALKLLSDHLKGVNGKRKVVLFFDELPWLATRKSGILQALDYTWNTQWSMDRRIKLIVCGSAASWMLEKILFSRGGLHNRITARIHLMPFNLSETMDYLKFRGIRLSREQVLELYMVMGGIPFYLKSVSPGLSAAQNIGRICFQPDGLLLDEFDRLFTSLFDSSEAHIQLIRLLARHRYGLSRNDLLAKSSRHSSGGTFRKRLRELEEAGFVTAFIPYGRASKGTWYRLIDEYTLFYLSWIEPVRRKLNVQRDSLYYWENKYQSQAWKSWSGYAFEAVCLKHISQIYEALEISAIQREVGSWRFAPGSGTDETGAQIDLLIDRADGIINVCEIKYHNKKLVMDKAMTRQLKHKIEKFKEQSKTKKQLFLTLISVYGLSRNRNSEEVVAREITLDDLFV